jgi:hypothetical protein
MRNFREFREIYTPFFSNKADEILRSVLGQLSDGLWENTRGYTKYWVNFNVERRANGQVYFLVNENYDKAFGRDYYINPFREMSDTQFLNWVAAKLKAVIAAEFKDNAIPSRDGWKRNNTTFESAYLSYNEKITVADIYVVYDWLKGRNIDMSSPIVKDILSNPRSEDQVKKIEDKQSEIDFIQANRDIVLAEIKEKYNDRIADLEDQLAELKEKMEAELKTVNTDCNAKVQALREELEKISA